jgi:hypothetical protein
VIPAFHAIETAEDTRKAVKVWRDKFAQDAEEISGLNETTFWHPRLAIWGHFQQWKRGDKSDRYWNVFGVVPTQLRKNVIVEINPPARGKDGVMQGVLARGSDGARWLLHKGRMSIPGSGISEEQFDEASAGVRRLVKFSDGTTVRCHPVANLDAGAKQLQNQVASFVATCRRVRLQYSLGEKVAQQEAAVEAAEQQGSPELTGSYKVSAQNAKIAIRRHAEVWHALVKLLDQIGAKHTNSRVGRWGPDLRTVGNQPVLFEIKVSNIASELQRAVGQLLLYEKLLKSTHCKVLVLPEPLEAELASAVQGLELKVLSFTRKGKLLDFGKGKVKQLIG